MPVSRLNLERLARYPAPARLGIFVLTLLFLWLPIAVPIYGIWGSGNTVSIVTMLALYSEFIFLLRIWGQKVHQQSYPLKSHGLVKTKKIGWNY